MRLFVITPRTPLSYDTTRLALVTRSSKHLTHHTHHFLNHHSTSLAARTRHGTRLTVFRHGHLYGLVCTSVYLIECQVDCVVPLTTVLWRRIHPTKHVLKNLRNVGTVRHLLLLRLVSSKLVVTCTSLRIVQNLVRLTNLLELFSVASSVWVVFQCEFLVRLFDVICRCTFFDTERLVVTHTDKEQGNFNRRRRAAVSTDDHRSLRDQ